MLLSNLNYAQIMVKTAIFKAFEAVLIISELILS